MVQVDLITGFLGAGKTTFLRRYVRYLVAQGHNVCILENDFGAVNVDAMLVQDLLGPNCDLETISGGCDCDTHQRWNPAASLMWTSFLMCCGTTRWTAGITSAM